MYFIRPCYTLIAKYAKTFTKCGKWKVYCGVFHVFFSHFALLFSHFTFRSILCQDRHLREKSKDISNETRNLNEIWKVYRECFVFRGVYRKNTREIRAKCDIRKVYNLGLRIEGAMVTEKSEYWKTCRKIEISNFCTTKYTGLLKNRNVFKFSIKKFESQFQLWFPNYCSAFNSCRRQHIHIHTVCPISNGLKTYRTHCVYYILFWLFLVVLKSKIWAPFHLQDSL